METPQEQHPEDLADLIQWITRETGDNDSQIARKIGAAPATVNSWRNRTRGTGRGPAAKNLRKLAAVYAGIGVTEDRVFAAVGRKRPGELSPDAAERMMKLFKELTADQQTQYEIQMRASVEHNRSGTS